MGIAINFANGLSRIVERPLWLTAIAAGLVAVERAAAPGGLEPLILVMSRFGTDLHGILDFSVGLLIVTALARAIWLARHLGRAKHRLQRRADNLNVILDSVSQGLATFDGNHRLVLANRKYYALYRIDEATLGPGTTIEEMLEARRQAGSFGENTQSYLHRMSSESTGGRMARMTVHLPDGRHMSVTRAPLPDGGWVSTHEDVTEQIALRSSLQATRDFLENVLNNIPIGISVLNLRTDTYAVVNDAGAKFYGADHKNEIIGRSPSAVMSSEGVKKIRALNDRALSDPEHTLVSEIQAVHTDEPFTVMSRRAVINGADGKPEYMITALEDVTHVRQLSAQVEQSRHFFETIINSLPTALAVKSVGDLRYHLVNDAFEKLTGRVRDFVLGYAPTEFYSERSGVEVENLHRRIIAGDASAASVKSIIDMADGSLKTVQARRKVLHDAAGNPEFVLALFDDITEQEQIADALYESKEFLASIVDEIPIALMV
ncbi:MAG: PAS-domain containing protein, partial [Hyphomicrobiaceae bacterium]|nr:PAS-domain containing protein [Hyphomicrobiaceae bacterium]